jgi:hypothetical protein
MNWQVPFIKCDSRKCDDKVHGHDAQPFCQYSMIGVTGGSVDDIGGHDRAKNFTQWLYATYPALQMNMPFDFPFVRHFQDPQGMDNYVKGKDYGNVDNPLLAMGIVWEGSDPSNYIYRLRQNSTNFNSPEAQWRPGTKTTPATNRLFVKYAKNDNEVCIPDDGTPKQGWLENSCTGQYVYNGVLTIQRLVGDYILEVSGAKRNGYFVAEAGVSFVPFPSFAYEEAGFYGELGGMY